MNRQSAALSFLPAALLAVGLAGPAAAATVTLTSCSVFPAGNRCATSVAGLVVGGASYDVTFRFGTLAGIYPNAPADFPFPPTSSGSFLQTLEAGRLLSEAIFGAGGQGVCDTSALVCDFRASLPIAGNSFSTDTVDIAPGFDGAVDLGSNGNTLNLMWARFSPTVVPVPAAAWLFASAVGGLAWLRRR